MNVQPTFYQLLPLTRHQHLLDCTLSSSRDDVEGFYFYDKGWRIVIQARFVYVSLNSAFGSFWTVNQHKIVKSKLVTTKKSDWLNSCSIKQFNNVKV